ncbi:hypothetical protein GCM10010271_62110 [Streptomyces kurssanovii]|nr:hypothetical protein GCM10010271_62110 [Streptomyces kurssanovii]
MVLRGDRLLQVPFQDAQEDRRGLADLQPRHRRRQRRGRPAGDLVARDKDGVLWLYLGRGDGTFTARTRTGGWNAYSELVGIGDGNRDGKPALYAYGRNGTAYYYAGTGSRSVAFAGRTPTKVLVNDGVRYDHVL